MKRKSSEGFKQFVFWYGVIFFKEKENDIFSIMEDSSIAGGDASGRAPKQKICRISYLQKFIILLIKIYKKKLTILIFFQDR